MVRLAMEPDLLHCATLGLKFIQAAGMPSATLDDCLQTCERLMNSPDAILFVSEVGVIAGAIVPLYYRPEYRQAYELFWWSEDGKGLELLQAFEAWAEQRGADEINMSTLHEFSKPAIDKLLVRRGYLPRDKVFTRSLK